MAFFGHALQALDHFGQNAGRALDAFGQEAGKNLSLAALEHCSV